MKIVLWSLLALFLIGNAFFVLPYHLSSDEISSTYSVNYKKDSLLLKGAFPDTTIQLALNMPGEYESFYADSAAKKSAGLPQLLVNVAIMQNLDFSGVSFPFYKVTSFRSIIPFNSIIKASNAPGIDSVALVGNIVINGKLTIKGICSPIYARMLVEKELASIIRKEMDKVETNINRRPAPDTTAQMIMPQPTALPTGRQVKK